MAEEYEMVYFDIYGRAEPTRMLLSHAKASWKDTLVTGEILKAKKEAGELPNGQVPVIIHKGKVLNESMAILRYTGNNLGYYPKDEFEAYKVDALTDFVNGELENCAGHIFTKDFSEAKQTKYAETLEKIVKKVSKDLEEHKGKFVCGDKISTADCYMAFMCFSFIHNEKMPGGADFTDKGKAVVDKYPVFKAYVELLRAEFADRLASRNSCSF